ncbi:MAG: HI0074 family nucleotidyltransferase substrate-binding subunit [Euryarchaeota archaeon]|uniref:Nucleotidyltransferase n=1 Tax=Candidatus Methanogaster sp. TaxID=3386292 RepID=A0AC61KZY6_9EURY|nr:HI0074 family nucleotidyltransferase substrate-binding subunit [Euryarchaeota archaeon]PXF58436.1 MAG: nucleotidyltransferase [ANME-2 cluster archaeon]
MIEAKVQLENLENAAERLKAALEYDPLELDIVMDAVIQRFEFTFETAWKSVKLAAKAVGYDCKSPKGCLKLAYRMGWIDDEERWLELLEARNLTSHTYDQETAIDVYETIKENFQVFGSLLRELREEIDR